MEQKLFWDEHRSFLEEFAASINPNDPLPLRVSSYNLSNDEIDGEIIHWALQYLSSRNCPSTLLNPIVRAVIERIKQQCQKSPDACGYNPEKKSYQPIKLMRSVTAMVDEVCLKALDNAELDLIMPRICLSKLPPKYEEYAVKNGRRIMEDRHVVVNDFNGLFGVTATDAQRTGYYAIFDGHGGLDAAAYSVSHLHYHLSVSKYYPNSPEDAIRDAFIRTDNVFIEKNEYRTLKGGTTALCVLHRPEAKMLYVGWVGDTQALLVKNRKVFQTVRPHKADVESEQKRIARQGGTCIMYNGIWRVNGQLAITRAIGDVDYKPYVTSEPEIMSIPLDGDEDFLIMASDGLWDHVKEDDAAITVYNMAALKATDTSSCISKYLVEKAKADGSTDNITIIIVFLKDPAIIGKSVADWTQQQVAMETQYATNNDPLYASDQIIGTAGGTLGSEGEEEDSLNNLVKIAPSPLGTSDLLGDAANNFYCDTNLNGSGAVSDIEQSSTGKRSAMDSHDEDLGPETDVDGGDEIMLSPTDDGAATKEDKQFELKEMDASEEAPEDYNPFAMHTNEEQFEVRQENIISFTDTFAAATAPHTNPFDIPVHEEDHFHVNDGEIPQEIPHDIADVVPHESPMESTESDYINQNVDVTDDCVPEQLPEVVNEEISLFDKIPESTATPEEHIVATPEIPNDVMDHEDVKEDDVQQDIQPDDIIPSVASPDFEQHEEQHMEDVNYEITSEQKSEIVVAELTRETPTVESGIIAESEEESEDEWNYIKGEHQKELEVKESHAVSQAIAESQEACSDLVNEDIEREPELVDLEKKEESEDTMASRLNPDAQEFVPSSPVNTHGGGMKENNLHLLEKDEILAQSPRKAPTENSLFDLPDAQEFNDEISKCPHEFDDILLPQSPTNYQEINLKEAMHGDEKKDEGVEDTSEKTPEIVGEQISDIIKNIPVGETVPGENDPMNMSYHQDIHDGSFSNNPHDLNSVHLLPSKEELEESGGEETHENGDVIEEDMKPEEDMFEPHVVGESEKPESELEAAEVLLDFAQQKPDAVDFVPQQHVNVTDLDSDLTGIVEQEAKVPLDRVLMEDLNLLPESDINKAQMDVEDSAESDHCFLKDTQTDLMATQETVIPSKVETPPSTPAATNNGVIDVTEVLHLTTSPEPQKLMEAVEKLAEPVAAKEEIVEEKLVETTCKTEDDVPKDDATIPATIGVAAAGLAVAATVAVANKASVVKKEEPKAKPRTTKPTPIAGATKAATAPKVGGAKPPTPGKVSPIKPPSTLSTRPKSSPATKAPVSTTTTKSPLTTARKPLVSPTTATKSPLGTKASPAPRVTATKSPLTRPASATTAKTTTTGVATKTATYASAPAAAKKTLTATRNLSTKPTVLSAKPKVPTAGGTSSSVTSTTQTTLTKTTRTALSTAKPRVPSATTTTTTRTTAAAKDPTAPKTSGLASKTTSRPTTASTKPIAPKPTITSTLRKTAETTSKVTTTNSARNGVKTSTTTTTSTAKRPGSLTTRTTTTTTTKKPVPRLGEKKQAPVSTVTAFKVLEVTEKLSNGDVLHTDGHVVDAIEVKKGVESQKIIPDNAAQLIIDLKND
uniref:Protein phosphatase 2c n=1 Tax=Nyssomyia neivai TaxID=330878 RepID=A0A1L8DL25_9DIPT